MHTLDFLEPTSPPNPATKTFKRHADGRIEKSSFNNIFGVSSHRAEPTSLDHAAAIIEAHAQRGHVLLKGLLDQALTNESRAGHTDTNAATDWICLDVDGVPEITSAEEFIHDCLPPELHNVSYIFQHSASAGIIENRGFSGHFYIALYTPTPAPMLKDWLKHLNLSNPRLRQHTELSASGVTLKWPLDITTCQNDKLIYIAPPVCEGFNDPIERRIEVVHKAQSKALLNFNFSPAQIDQQAADRVNELRQAADLPRRTAKYKITTSGEYYVSNPERAQITGPIKQERGFTYLQLNGSNSWCYWHPTNNPKWLHCWASNEKYRTADLLPEYFEQAKNTPTEPSQYLAIHDIISDAYFNGEIKNGEVTLHQTSSKDKLHDFLTQRNQPVPEAIPDWTIGFNPQSNETINFEQRTINTYQPSAYIKKAEYGTHLPPICKRVIWSALGADQEAFDHYLNWLAVIYQKRIKTQTAWILHGMPGTGKGVLFNHIIQPTLGRRHAIRKNLQSLEDQFNDWLESCLFLFVDEVEVRSLKQAQAMMHKLKELITEPTATIRRMRTSGYETPTYNNLQIAANVIDSVIIEENDRRFNVAPRQEERLTLTTNDIKNLELQAFTDYITHRPADIDQASTILDNEARRNLIEAAETSAESFFKALKNGDLEFFLENYHNSGAQDPVNYGMYRTLIEKWASQPTAHLTRGEILQAYRYLINNRMQEGGFGRLLSINGLKPRSIKVKGTFYRGLLITWKTPQSIIDGYLGKNIIKLHAEK